MNNRQKEILQVLRHAEDFVTAGWIADRIGCSERTVRTEIGKLKGQMEQTGFARLESRANKGYRLLAEETDWKRLLEQTDRTIPELGTFLGIREEDRILYELRRSDTLRIAELEKLLFTNHRNVAQALDRAEIWAEEHRIKLDRRRGRGVWLEGESHWKRLAEWALYLKIRPQLKEKMYVEEGLGAWYGDIEAAGIFQNIHRLEERFQCHLSYGGFERLTFLTASMIADQRRGSDYRFPFEDDLSGWEWEAAGFYLEKLEQDYHIRSSSEERKYLWFAIASSEIEEFRTAAMSDRNVLEKQRQLLLVKRLMAQIGAILQRDFSGDSILLGGLLNYLSPWEINIRFGRGEGGGSEKSETPQINDAVYIACWSASHLLEEELHTVVTGQEIENIAAHFGGALQREKITADVYLVCTYGVGISRFLSEQLKGFFPGIRNLDVLTPRDFRGKKRLEPYDLVLSTVDLPECPPDKLLRIPGRLRVPDIQMIGRRLQSIHRSRQIQKEEAKKNLHYELFSPDLTIILKQVKSKQELIHRMCEMLKERGCVDARFEETVWIREDVSTTVLSSGVAIPHGFMENAIKSKIAVALLKHPVEWNGHEEVVLVFLLALDMRRDPAVKESVMSFYKGLIALLDEQGMLRKLLEMENAEQLSDRLNELVKKYSVKEERK